MPLLHGQFPPLSSSQALPFFGGLAALFVIPLLLFILVDQLKKRLFPKPIYNQVQVARKTGQMAYHARIRLYVFSPGARRSLRHLCWRYTLLVAGAMRRTMQRTIRRTLQ